LSKFRDFLCDVGLVIGVWLVVSGGAITLPALPSWLPSITTTKVPLKSMRVLILDETAPKAPLPNEQQNAIRSLAVRAYLDSNTLADSKGGKGWRKEDPDASFANLPKEWQDIRAKVKPTEYPWVAIADDAGHIAFEGKFPYPEVDALAFFKKYGG
jgi:hypothetical protein